MPPHIPDILLKDFQPRSLLKRPDNTPEKARFLVVDAHNHLFGDLPPEELLRIMDAVGVQTWVNVTGNVVLPFDEAGYTIERRPIEGFIDHYVKAYPGRFTCLTMSEFARWENFGILAEDDFVDRAIQTFEADVAKGACGFKLTKELGLRFRDKTGAMIPVDDARLEPIFRRVEEMGLPTLIHVSDPEGFFIPMDETNEHYPVLQEFPSWAFQDSFFSKNELLEQRNRLIARHPKMNFILPHVANSPEDLDRVASWLDTYSNTYIDISARVDELGRQPYTARDFFIEYQDRILFGIDMPVSEGAYRAYFRFLETRDEYFEYPDYLGRWGHCRWRIYGLDLPDEALRKVYHENAERVAQGR
ncbi:MAG: amidohydrolase family protein [Armatimonadetes bacterium]|nr:amidohydrolase family protein [Armatimonadota bacterium]